VVVDNVLVFSLWLNFCVVLLVAVQCYFLICRLKKELLYVLMNPTHEKKNEERSKWSIRLDWRILVHACVNAK